MALEDKLLAVFSALGASLAASGQTQYAAYAFAAAGILKAIA